MNGWEIQTQGERNNGAENGGPAESWKNADRHTERQAQRDSLWRYPLLQQIHERLQKLLLDDFVKHADAGGIVASAAWTNAERIEL